MWHFPDISRNMETQKTSILPKQEIKPIFSKFSKFKQINYSKNGEPIQSILDSDYYALFLRQQTPSIVHSSFSSFQENLSVHTSFTVLSEN